jgi:HEAT repeat protein
MEKKVNEQDWPGFVKMIADYMEEGLLDNIVSMLKADKTQYPVIGELIADERIRVRLGATALVEILAEREPESIELLAVPSILKVLNHENPTIRGDAANLLAIAGSKEAVSALLAAALHEEQNQGVRETLSDALDAIAKKNIP